MRIWFAAATIVALSACSGMFISSNREALSQLAYGMTKDQVHGVMGRGSFGNYNNPYRTAMYMGKDEKPIEVFYYWTDHTIERGIPDQDLTPVVFNDGKVVGWGREFWSDFVTKYELRIKSQ